MVLAVTAERMKLSNPVTVDAAYASFVSEALRQPYLAPSVVDNMLKVMTLTDPRVAQRRQADLVDESWVRRMERDGRLAALFSAYHVQ